MAYYSHVVRSDGCIGLSFREDFFFCEGTATRGSNVLRVDVFIQKSSGDVTMFPFVCAAIYCYCCHASLSCQPVYAQDDVRTDVCATLSRGTAHHNIASSVCCG